MVHFLKIKYFIIAINQQVRNMSKKKIAVTQHCCRTIQELILCHTASFMLTDWKNLPM